MSGGWLAGVAAFLLLGSLPGDATAAFFVNGRAVSSSPLPQMDGTVTRVPLLAWAPLLGIEAVEGYGRVSLRWHGGRWDAVRSELPSVSGVAAASLDDLVQRVGGTVRRAGGDTWIEVPVARVDDLTADAAHLTLALSRFAPTSVSRVAGMNVIRFANCLAEGAEQSVTFGPGGVGRATLVPLDGVTCELRITFLEEAALAVRRIVSGSSYSLVIAPAEQDMVVSAVDLAPGIIGLEARCLLGGGEADVAVVTVGDWRSRVELMPLLSAESPGEVMSLARVAAMTGTAIAIASRTGAETGVVVRDGVPWSLAAASPMALGFDVLGTPFPLVSDLVAVAVTPAGRLALDGVNQPVGYDEVVACLPGYMGDIARGFPDGFRVVRVRDGAVVSILDEPFVVADPSATLLVASGRARSRLDGIALGDRVELACETSPERRGVVDALSIDGLLVWGGEPTSFWAPAATWSVVGADWLGGFFFLSLCARVDVTAADVLVALALLSVHVRDVVVLEQGGSASMWVHLASYQAQWGYTADARVALGGVTR